MIQLRIDNANFRVSLIELVRKYTGGVTKTYRLALLIRKSKSYNCFRGVVDGHVLSVVCGG